MAVVLGVEFVLSWERSWELILLLGLGTWAPGVRRLELGVGIRGLGLGSCVSLGLGNGSFRGDGRLKCASIFDFTVVLKNSGTLTPYRHLFSLPSKK